MSERVSNGWGLCRLSDMGQYINGYGFKPEDWSKHGLPIIRIAQITGSSEECDHFSGSLPEQFRVSSGDLIFSWSGTLVVVRWDGGPAWLNQHLFRVIPDEGVDRDFLYHLLTYAVEEMGKRAHGSTMKHIKRGELREYHALVPNSLDEQKAIAQILDTLDTQIRQTETLIAKLETVKQGLLTDLLTRGINENGQLRPPPEQAPELYKDSPLGRIPVEWEVKTIGSVLAGIDAGWSPSCPEDPPREGEWGVLKVSAVSSGVFKPEASKRLPTDLCPRQSIEVRENDVLLVRANGVADLVGRCAYVHRTPSRLMLSDKTLRLNPLPGKVTPYFLATVMGSTFVRGQIDGLMSGSSGQKNISQRQIETIMTAIPSIREQKLAERALSDVDERLVTERDEVGKLEISKAGLMDDLLTGRTRVTPLLKHCRAAKPVVCDPY